jgi:endo-1,4-beta-mannosidase
MEERPQATDRFVLGVNYWPRSSAMAMWSRFDPAEIDEDFARIAALGLDVVRFFLMWEAFQPAPERIAGDALAHFERVLESAHRHGLRTMPTLFCGHMSGVNWLPPWALDPGRPAGRFRTMAGGSVSPHGIGDFYGGPLLAAQRVQAKALAERARNHPAVLAWDLGNEFSNLREPASTRAAAEWSAVLTDDLQTASGIRVTAGIHGEDLTLDRNIRPSSLCAPFAYATMHGYPAYSAFARGVADPEVVPFLAALTSSFAGKPVLFSEFGNPACTPFTRASAIPCLEEDAMAQYASAVLCRLHARGALGAFWWCWTDYDPALAATPPFDCAPHELSFGIVRADGSEKPVARALSAFARERRSVVAGGDMVETSEDSYYQGLPRSTGRTFAAYLRAHGTGAR